MLQAKKLNVNYAFLSPVKKTSSHIDSVPLGWKEFKRLSEKVKFPVYALGGMSMADMETAISNSAFGIAMISSVWDKPDGLKENSFFSD